MKTSQPPFSASREELRSMIQAIAGDDHKAKQEQAARKATFDRFHREVSDLIIRELQELGANGDAPHLDLEPPQPVTVSNGDAQSPGPIISFELAVKLGNNSLVFKGEKWNSIRFTGKVNGSIVLTTNENGHLITSDGDSRRPARAANWSAEAFRGILLEWLKVLKSG